VLAFYLVLLVLIVLGVFHWWRRSRKYAPDDMLRNNVDQLKYRILYVGRYFPPHPLAICCSSRWAVPALELCAIAV